MTTIADQLAAALAEELEMVHRVLTYYANQCAYEPERTGGVLAGCPRGPQPTPEQLTVEAACALRTFEPVAREFLAAYRQSTTPAQAPAQAAEPVAWIDQETFDCLTKNLHGAIAYQRFLSVGVADHFQGRTIPLYAAPRPSEPAATGRVGLTDERILAEATAMFSRWREDIQPRFVVMIARAIESAHGIPAPTGSAAPTGEA